jgi:hypothetical protein
MKNIIIVVTFLILLTSKGSFAQILAKQVFKKPAANKSINSYATPAAGSKGKKLERIGFVLAGGSIVALGGGALLLADAGIFSADYYKEKKWKNASTVSIIERYAGYALIDLGTYAVAGGVVMIIIGNKKVRREKAAINFTFTPVSTGVGYRF